MLKLFSFFVLFFVCFFIFYVMYSKVLKKYDEVIRILVPIIINMTVFIIYNAFIIPIL